MSSSEGERDEARPFVDRPLRDAQLAERVARVAAKQLGLSAPRFVRAGMNAVFRCDDVALRVGLPSVAADASLHLAAWLDGLGLVVPRPARDRAITVDDAEVGIVAATAWEWIEARSAADPRRDIDWEAIGEMLAMLHSADIAEVPDGVPLPHPWRFPWWNFDEMFVGASDWDVGVNAESFAAMREVVDKHRGWTASGEPNVLCHGDVHPGNVIMGSRGAVLIDWDLLCRAPRGWDHAPMLRFASHWGGDRGWYHALASGYGCSFDGDPFAESAAELRLVAATLMRVRAATADTNAAPEAQRRLDSWRGVDVGAWHAQ